MIKDTLFRKLETYRLKAQANLYAGDFEQARYWAYLYGQVYRQIAKGA